MLQNVPVLTRQYLVQPIAIPHKRLAITTNSVMEGVDGFGLTIQVLQLRDGKRLQIPVRATMFLIVSVILLLLMEELAEKRLRLDVMFMDKIVVSVLVSQHQQPLHQVVVVIV